MKKTDMQQGETRSRRTRELSAGQLVRVVGGTGTVQGERSSGGYVSKGG